MLITDIESALILKYYSFENYFMNPEVMAQLHVIDTPEDFYRIFLEKWQEYLSRMKSGQKIPQAIGHDLLTIEDVQSHMEDIRIHIRGHNLYDIFYGRYKHEETELLKRYIEIAPREDFSDILDNIDRFIYFENRSQR